MNTNVLSNQLSFSFDTLIHVMEHTKSIMGFLSCSLSLSFPELQGQPRRTNPQINISKTSKKE